MPLAFLASLCETDSPGTGEVARSARRGAVAPQGRRERTSPLPEIFRVAGQFSPPPPAGGALRARAPLPLARHLPTPWGVTLAEGAKG